MRFKLDKARCCVKLGFVSHPMLPTFEVVSDDRLRPSSSLPERYEVMASVSRGEKQIRDRRHVACRISGRCLASHSSLARLRRQTFREV